MSELGDAVLMVAIIGVIIAVSNVIGKPSTADTKNAQAESLTQAERKAHAQRRADAEAEEHAEEESRRNAEAEEHAEAESRRKAEAEAYAEAEAEAEAEAKLERDLQKQREQDEYHANRVTDALSLMQKSLPFYCSVTDEEGSESHAGKLRWKETLKAIQVTDESDATLYFVKLLSLLDNKQYYKIGITTKSVEERFETSTQIELLEVVATFNAARYLVLFLEYHFIREFEITDELSKLPDMSGPGVKFSGSSEVVRANARGKISGFFEKLKDYEDKVLKGVVELV
jgi:hypothetical protein